MAMSGPHLANKGWGYYDKIPKWGKRADYWKRKMTQIFLGKIYFGPQGQACMGREGVWDPFPSHARVGRRVPERVPRGGRKVPDPPLHPLAPLP